MQLRNGSRKRENLIAPNKKAGVKRRIDAERQPKNSSVANLPNQMEFGTNMMHSYQRLSQQQTMLMQPYPGKFNFMPQNPSNTSHQSSNRRQIPNFVDSLQQKPEENYLYQKQIESFFQTLQQKQMFKKGRNVPVSVEENNAIESLPLVLENGEGKAENTKFTEVQLKRKVQCRTKEEKIFEVPWCLMMQSQVFADMWTNLGQEDEIADKEQNNMDKDSPFVFNLPTISAKCLRQIVNWMRHRHGQPEFELKFGKETGQQIWFKPDKWERQFGFGNGLIHMDLEEVKELYLAANFLDLPSLYHYCVQEFAFFVIQVNNLEQVRENLCLIDDLTSEEKAAIYREFDLPFKKEKLPNIWKGIKTILKLKNPLPPELMHPIFAKLSLSDQRWLLPLNRNAYSYLADRVRKNWPKWIDTLNKFIIEKNPKWYYGKSGAYIPSLQHGLPSVQWKTSNLLAHRSLRMEMLNTLNFIENAINSINAEPIPADDQIDKLLIENNKKKLINSTLLRSIEHMDKLLIVEKEFQRILLLNAKRYKDMTSMNCYKQGILHLLEQRQQILEEMEANGMKELRKIFANSEEDINEEWVQRL